MWPLLVGHGEKQGLDPEDSSYGHGCCFCFSSLGAGVSVSGGVGNLGVRGDF